METFWYQLTQIRVEKWPLKRRYATNGINLSGAVAVKELQRGSQSRQEKCENKEIRCIGVQ